MSGAGCIIPTPVALLVTKGLGAGFLEGDRGEEDGSDTCLG